MNLWTNPWMFIAVIFSWMIFLFIGWHYSTVTSQDIWLRYEYRLARLEPMLNEIEKYLADNANRRDNESIDLLQQNVRQQHTVQDLIEQFKSFKQSFNASQNETPRVLTRRVKRPDRLQITLNGPTYQSTPK